ncbi:glycosyltransferase [Chryseobacterium taklimakanense]|uniref:Glycosyltransferase n=1 Tax=Chryseobacterium taklimakanense TaxID=536441 RepID=A0A3G8WEQ4_9FLAO|nr:glycosyltransferase [Chryseobacterium taklimakanense]AZI19605.1 glycosyltransferase [Chryseobacterium taklimakanense]
MVITDSDGGAKDMVIDGKTGLVSPKNDAEKLAANIEKVILNENLRNDLAENAFKRLENMAANDNFHTWAKILFKN